MVHSHMFSLWCFFVMVIDQTRSEFGQYFIQELGTIFTPFFQKKFQRTFWPNVNKNIFNLLRIVAKIWVPT